MGLLLTGSGIEATVALNKISGIRAAMVHTYFLSAVTREVLNKIK